LSNAGAITTESQGTGSAGNVALAVSGALTLNFGIISTNVAVLNPATSTATTETSGGNIVIGADEVLMNNASAILTANDGPGRGGDIAIGTRHFFANGSSVSTTAQRGDGGNMRLTVGYLFDIVDTNILSSVRTGVGNGGNIIIDPPFMVLDGSRIEANAFGGDGGNILIQAGQLISSPDSVIQASSELGIDGNIDIAAPETDVGGAIAILPDTFLDNANLLADTCAARGGKPGSSLMAGGRGGLPPDPGEPLSFDFGASVPLGTPDENSAETGGTVPTGVLTAASSFAHTGCAR
jgi:large exoprotein involved in heme utilization and adhesion